MDSALDSLLVYLRRRVVSRTFRAAPATTSQHASLGTRTADALALLKEQRARAAVSRCFHTFPEAKKLQYRHCLILVVDVGLSSTRTISIVRRIPAIRSRSSRSPRNPYPLLQEIRSCRGSSDVDYSSNRYGDDEDIDEICDAFSTALHLNSTPRPLPAEEEAVAGPSLNILLPPLDVKTLDPAVVAQVLSRLEAALADFPREMLQAVVVTGAQSPPSVGSFAPTSEMEEEQGPRVFGDVMLLLADEDSSTALATRPASRGPRALAQLPASTTRPETIALPSAQRWSLLQGAGGGAVAWGPGVDLHLRVKPSAELANWAWGGGEGSSVPRLLPVATEEESYDLDNDVVDDDDDEDEADDYDRRWMPARSLQGKRGVEQLSLDSLTLNWRSRAAAAAARSEFRVTMAQPDAAVVAAGGASVDQEREKEEAGLGAALKRCRIQEPSARNSADGAGRQSSAESSGFRGPRKRENPLGEGPPHGTGAAVPSEGLNGSSENADGGVDGSDGWECFGSPASRGWTVSPRPKKRLFRRNPALHRRSNGKDSGAAESEPSTAGIFPLPSVPENDTVAAWANKSADDASSKTRDTTPAAAATATATPLGNVLPSSTSPDGAQRKRLGSAVAKAAANPNPISLFSCAGGGGGGSGGGGTMLVADGALTDSPPKRHLASSELRAVTGNLLHAHAGAAASEPRAAAAAEGLRSGRLREDKSGGTNSPVLVSCFAEDGKSPEEVPGFIKQKI